MRRTSILLLMFLTYLCSAAGRKAQTQITTFDVPGAGFIPHSIKPEAITGSYVINPAGAITGFFVDANHVNHGFVRLP